MTSNKIRETEQDSKAHYEALTAALKTTNSKDYKLYYMNASSNLKSELKS